MELLEIIIKEIGDFCIGLYGFLIMIVILNSLTEGIEKVVRWVANRVNKIRKANSIRK